MLAEATHDFSNEDLVLVRLRQHVKGYQNARVEIFMTGFLNAGLGEQLVHYCLKYVGTLLVLQLGQLSQDGILKLLVRLLVGHEELRLHLDSSDDSLHKFLPRFRLLGVD